MDYASHAQARNVGMVMASQAQASTVRESTQLEVHLNALYALHEELNKAFARSLNMADRLLGQEPQSINKPDAAKEPTDPPILRRFEVAINQATDMVQSIHYQLNRLERL